MNISTNTASELLCEIHEHTKDIRSFYDDMRWNDDVYESFDQYVSDMEKDAENTKELVKQAIDVISQLTDVNVSALEAEFNSACAD